MFDKDINAHSKNDCISRTDAAHVLCVACGNAACDPYECSFFCAMEDVPAADVRPVVRAEWIDNGMYKAPTCSNCGSGCLLNYESDYHESDFCPHCGADMRGK